MANYPISRFADVNGDGTGSIEGNIDASATNVVLKVTPGLSQTFRISKLIIYIEDKNLNADGYGGMNALTNGINIHLVRYSGEPEEVILWDISSYPIKSNGNWKSLCYEEILSNYGQQTQSLCYRYDFAGDGRGSIIIDGANKEEFRIILRDDFTSLQTHKFRIGMDDKPFQ